MSNRESFYGFNMTDDEVGPGNRRDLAIEVKHIFEGIANEASEKNEEIFLAPELEHAVRRFVVDPCQASLDYLLEVSPVLTDTFSELQALLNIVRSTPKDSENKASDTSGIVDDCDLIAVAREMQEIIGVGIAQANEDGGIICCEIEFRQIMENFIEHPTRQTAKALLDVAPTLEIVSLFTKHTPNGKMEYDNCAKIGSEFGLELWRLIVDEAKMFHQTHKDYIALNQSDFVQEELCIAVYIADKCLASWSDSNHEPFTSAALSVIAACFETEFAQTEGFFPFLKKSMDRIHEYEQYRFGGEEDDNLAGSFRWESALRALGSNHPNPGTLLAYCYRKAAIVTEISKLLHAHVSVG